MNADEQRLLDAYVDETIEAADFPKLELLLEHSEEARKQLRLLATISEGLSDFELEAELISVPSEPNKARFSWPQILPWAIAAAACVGLIIQSADGLKRSETPISLTEKGGIVALLVDEAGAEFAKDRGPSSEVQFEQGDYQLTDGAVHLRFSNGADLVMRAPVEFSVEDAFNVTVAHGNVRAIVPPPAQGFTIASPGIDYEDLGTEFGVMVDRASGDSELHVFDGQVNVRDPESSKLIKPAFVGDSFHFDGTELTSTNAPATNAFLTPGAIGFLRWEKWKNEFEGDSGLIGFFTFSEKGKLLKNEVADSPMSDGEVNGARWVTGRWPEKKALLFDRDTDFVEFDLPGEFTELSMAVWLKVDRFDQELSAVFNSNEWESGDLHWQINRVRMPWFGINSHHVSREFTGKPIESGQWAHLAMVMSQPENRADVFVNGKLVTTGKFPMDGFATPGKCRLGNWLKDPEWPHAPVRALRGRIDEFAVWNRPLSEKEIQKTMKIGQPTALWSVAPTEEFTQLTR